MIESAGGVEERGDVQRALGELRYVDEYSPARGDLYLKGDSFLILFQVHDLCSFSFNFIYCL